MNSVSTLSLSGPLRMIGMPPILIRSSHPLARLFRGLALVLTFAYYSPCVRRPDTASP